MELKVGKSYKHIVDVMNNVFGWNYKACMKGCYLVHSNPDIYAWFPKITESANGILLPNDKWYKWCNTISDDMEFIYMINYENPERMHMVKNNPDPHITFIKRNGKDYEYAGVYVRQYLDKKRGWVYKRVHKNVKLEEVLNNNS